MWKWRHKRQADLEARLRNHRPEARDEFVDTLSAAVAPRAGGTRRSTSSRLAFAAAVSVFILGTFASFGGLSYAASGATGAYHAVKQVPTGHVSFTVHKSSATAQYAPTTKPKKPKATKTEGAVAGVRATLSNPKASGSLPFTGLSLAGTAVLSLALIGLGLALRRREHQG